MRASLGTLASFVPHGLFKCARKNSVYFFRRSRVGRAITADVWFRALKKLEWVRKEETELAPVTER